MISRIGTVTFQRFEFGPRTDTPLNTSTSYDGYSFVVNNTDTGKWGIEIGIFWNLDGIFWRKKKDSTSWSKWYNSAQYYTAMVSTNCLGSNMSDLLDAVNSNSVIGTENASTLTNSPVTSGAFYAFREVLRVGNTKVIIRLTEAYPQSRIWLNRYDKNSGSWSGWTSK